MRQNLVVNVIPRMSEHLPTVIYIKEDNLNKLYLYWKRNLNVNAILLTRQQKKQRSSIVAQNIDWKNKVMKATLLCLPIGK